MRIILLIIPICLGFSATLHEVSIVSFAFSPQSLTINTGDTVRWINNDTVPHTSTSDNGDWDSEALSNGDTFKQVFLNTGTFQYHCTFHSSMVADITVCIEGPLYCLDVV